MAYHKRRNHGANRLRSLLPLISVVSCSLLILLGFLSFLAPSPPHTLHPDGFRPLNNNLDDTFDQSGSTVFHIPNESGRPNRDIWTSRNAKYFVGCSEPKYKFPKNSTLAHPNRYLLIATSGGLNQQRTGITDAIVAARILNATLVIPKLDQKSFWKDSSSFSDIFEVDWFINHLKNDVKVVKELPKKGGKTWITHNMRVPRKCSERCYQNRVLPVLLKRHAIQLTKFDYRLANKLDTHLQKLRCRVNYHALRFTHPIRQMGEKLVHRMRLKSKRFIALHLRFEPDMLAFSGCYYGGGDRERQELGAIRKRWKTLHVSNPDKERRHGKCPLTPKEVGLMLRALGYGSDVHIYVASGEVYRSEESLAPLKTLFPNFHTKDTLATKDELLPFQGFSSRMAALDFIVCDESDVFITNNNGNMARILAGRRRYFGHKPTIRPNAKKLFRLFVNQTDMTWDGFKAKVINYQRGFMGEPKEVRPGRGEFHENPHTCICEKEDKDFANKFNVINEDDQELPDPDNDGDKTEDEFLSEDLEIDDLLSD